LRPSLAVDIADVRFLRPDPAIFAAGFLRWQPAGNVDELPADLRTPTSLAWGGLTTARCLLKLSLAAGLLLKGALLNKLLALYATAELELLGVAPRLPLRIRFDPAALLGALAEQADEQRRLARVKLLGFLRQDLRSLPLEIRGELDDPDEFAATLADWVRARFGVFVPSPHEDGQPGSPVASPWTPPTSTTLRDIGEASFGPPPPQAEAVHGPDDRVQINDTALYPWCAIASLLSPTNKWQFCHQCH
jgi:hypothetical protein